MAFLLYQLPKPTSKPQGTYYSDFWESLASGWATAQKKKKKRNTLNQAIITYSGKKTQY